MAEEWGPWIEHDGRSVPKLAGMVVHLVFADGDEWVGVEGGSASRSKFGVLIVPDLGDPVGWIWTLSGCRRGYDEIVRYRIRRPDALRNLIDLAEQVEHLTPETVKALVGV